MAGAAVLGRLSWRVAEVAEVVEETASARSLVLDCPGWPGHLPGQHVDVRLTAEDGYQAQRSYSISTPADGERFAVTVEEVPDGEVSPYLVGEARPGDRLEVRGPIGGYFVWEPGRYGVPLQLVAGGSGVVPLMAMVRARAATDGEPVRMLLSARSLDDAIFGAELLEASTGAGWLTVDVTLTRRRPEGWTGLSGRVDAPMLAERAWPPADGPLCFVCGPTGFVEAVSASLIALGHTADRIRTERFGPTGGPA